MHRHISYAHTTQSPQAHMNMIVLCCVSPKLGASIFKKCILHDTIGSRDFPERSCRWAKKNTITEHSDTDTCRIQSQNQFNSKENIPLHHDINNYGKQHILQSMSTVLLWRETCLLQCSQNKFSWKLLSPRPVCLVRASYNKERGYHQSLSTLHR